MGIPTAPAIDARRAASAPRDRSISSAGLTSIAVHCLKPSRARREGTRGHASEKTEQVGGVATRPAPVAESDAEGLRHQSHEAWKSGQPSRDASLESTFDRDGLGRGLPGNSSTEMVATRQRNVARQPMDADLGDRGRESVRNVHCNFPVRIAAVAARQTKERFMPSQSSEPFHCLWGHPCVERRLRDCVVRPSVDCPIDQSTPSNGVDRLSTAGRRELGKRKCGRQQQSPKLATKTTARFWTS